MLILFVMYFQHQALSSNEQRIADGRHFSEGIGVCVTF